MSPSQINTEALDTAVRAAFSRRTMKAILRNAEIQARARYNHRANQAAHPFWLKEHAPLVYFPRRHDLLLRTYRKLAAAQSR